ncbi:MAG: hypothetical protein K2O12_00715, partial [Muribaculaceae bacterium]|nr:hypothetical protein [Muribaculaceae bacterium]
MKPIVCSMILASIAGIAFQADAQQYTTVATPEQFSAAFEAKAERIRITADITSTSDSPYLVDKNMTIDLNGHKVTLASTIIPRNNIDLTIEDTNAAHTGILANTSASVITKPVPGTVY